MNAQVERIMKGLGCTEEEALEILAEDNDIDHGKKKDYDLTAEQEKESRKARSTTSGPKKPLTLEKKPRPRKENPTKRDLIKYIAECMEDYADSANVQIENVERIVHFFIGDDKYEIILQCKRKPKS